MATKAPYTPMMMHYLSVKEQNKDTLIFYRLGDFYELFFEDAKIASRELQLVLTARDAGSTQKVPMCGVPHHAVNGYIQKLINKGFKVGIVEQLEDASLAKGLVKRDVIQIITPGTLMDVGLEDGKNNYLAAVEDFTTFFVIAFCDISTGELGVINCEYDVDALKSELETLEVKEIVIGTKFNTDYFNELLLRKNVTVSYQKDSEITLEYEKLFVDINDIRQMKTLVRLVDYLVSTQKRSLDYLQKAKVLKFKQFLQMDSYTRFNLELTRTIRTDDRYGSLLWIVDKTYTAMGARLLKNYLTRPLADVNQINQRLDMVEVFFNDFILRNDMTEALKGIYDLARLIARVSYGNTNGRDLIQLSKSLNAIPKIKELLLKSNNPLLIELANDINELKEIYQIIDKAIVENPPLSIKEGDVIKDNYHPTLDEYRQMSSGGKQWISKLEADERIRTGIKTLKIGFNRVFGFYIEVSKGAMDLVKDEYGYIRKQTLANGERYITEELKQKEELVLSAQEKAVKLEYELFMEIREKVKGYSEELQKLSDNIAKIDIINSLATIAVNNNFVRPKFNESGVIEAKQCRHPVIEKVLGHQGYVPNDIRLDKANNILLITGPNMGGKSTYMRQVAILVILAQIGSYVPAQSANLSVVDKIFTRIGASDDLVSGQSTFMVEMSEANNAIRNATSNSLIIFDEIGRGTSTYDGMALAQAIIEYISLNIKALTLFSTHYHELTSLQGVLPGLVNVSVGIHEENDRVTFLYKIINQAANKSYGINVARLAHLPEQVLQRANDILLQLQENKINSAPVSYHTPKIEKPNEYLQQIKDLDPLSLTPMEALNFLYELHKKVK